MGRATSPLRDRMIFVVGARRSGTNWVQRVLAAHPEVAAVPSETYLFSRGILPLTERFHHGSPGSVSLGTVYVSREGLLDALRDLCDRVLGGLLATLRPGATRLCERTPEHAACLDLIGEIYPDARVVHIIRDGRDVARSLAGQAWGPGSLRAAAEEWVSHVTAARAAGARLVHYHEVRYEEMLADPCPHVAALFGFCGLDAGEALIREALREAEVPFNVDPNVPSVGAGKWRATLDAAQLAEVHAVAGRLLAELGYATDEPPAPEGGPRRPEPEPALRRALWPVLAGRARSLTGRARSRLAGRGGQTDVHRRIFEVQAAADAVAAALSARDGARLATLLAPDALVRVVDDGRDRRARGEAGRDLLERCLATDPALDGTLVRGDVHPAVPTCSVVARYRTPDGACHDRVLVVTEEAGAVTALTWYTDPAGAG
jgi:hypothetical protein